MEIDAAATISSDGIVTLSVPSGDSARTRVSQLSSDSMSESDSSKLAADFTSDLVNLLEHSRLQIGKSNQLCEISWTNHTEDLQIIEETC